MNDAQLKDVIKMLAEMESVLVKKGHDYSGETDTLANFKELEDLDISCEMSIFIRLTDKYVRLKNFMRLQDLKSSEESIDDTLLDLANYCLLMRLARRERK
jgi:hypothetical protein